MTILKTVPAMSLISQIQNGQPWTRVYSLEDNVIQEYCRDSGSVSWYKGALSGKHQGSCSIAAVSYVVNGLALIDVFTIYANRINCWHWDGKSWSGGNTQNYGQDYVFASRHDDTTVLLTRNPEKAVTYTIKGGTWTPTEGPSV